MKKNIHEDYSIFLSTQNNEKKTQNSIAQPSSRSQVKSDLFLPVIDCSNSKYFIKSFKPKIISAIDSTIRELDAQNSESRTVRTSPCSLRKNRTSSFKSLQQKNLNKIKLEEKLQVEEALNMFKSSNQPLKNPEYKKVQVPNTSNQKMDEIQKFLRKKSLDESETSEHLLSKLNKKIEKSVDLYQDLLEKKKKFAMRNSKRAFSVNTVVQDEEQVLSHLVKIVSKNKEVETRKNKFYKQVQDSLSKKKEEVQKRVQKAKEVVENNEKSESFKIREIENRIKAYEAAVGNHKKSVERVKREKFEKIRDKEADAFRKYLKNTEKQ